MESHIFALCLIRFQLLTPTGNSQDQARHKRLCFQSVFYPTTKKTPILPTSWIPTPRQALTDVRRPD